MYDNWGGVTGLRGTGSCDCSVENYHLPEHFTFVWDLLKPQAAPRRPVVFAAALQLRRQGAWQRRHRRRRAARSTN